MWSALTTPFLLFSAWLLLLLVSLSVPIIKTIFFLTISSDISSGVLGSSVTGTAKFGLWGYCVSAIDVSVAGFSDDTTSASCSNATLGYTFDSTLASDLDLTDLENSISHALTAVLVLHPIACGLVFLALLASFFMCIRHRSGENAGLSSTVTLALTLLATLVTVIIFIIDCVFVAVVHSKVSSATDGAIGVSWGNAVWLVLGAMIALLLASMGACAGICSCGSRRRFRSDKEAGIARY